MERGERRTSQDSKLNGRFSAVVLQEMFDAVLAKQQKVRCGEDDTKTRKRATDLLK
jgi:hypothetical protein